MVAYPNIEYVLCVPYPVVLTMTTVVNCTNCRATIPETQCICPECYMPTGSSQGHEIPTLDVRKNLMFFFSDSVLTQLYWGRATEYLAERIKWNFYAETPEAFAEITRKSAGSWGLLLVDTQVVEHNKQILSRFIKKNPGIVTGVLCQTAVPKAPFSNVVMFKAPSDIDDWLLLMHQLLNMSGN